MIPSTPTRPSAHLPIIPGDNLMPVLQTLSLTNPDRRIAMTGNSVGVILPADIDDDSSTSAPVSSTFVVPMNQRPLIKLVSLSEASLRKLANGDSILTETESSASTEMMSVDQARELIKELEAACQHIESMNR
jgi:hypothetical protein